MNNNTIFDDVFRTMVEKMTYLLVPLINEVFHTSYPEDVKIVHLRNEHQLEDGELIRCIILSVRVQMMLRWQSGCLSMILLLRWRAGGGLDGDFLWSFPGPV